MRNFTLFFLLNIISYSTSAQNPTWDWASNHGYTNNERAENIAKDSKNNVYIVGTFSDSIQFGSFRLTKLFPSYYSSVFIVKYDSIGNVIWAKSPGGEANAYGIAVDKNDNIIIGGAFYTTTYFGPSIFLNNGGSADIYIAKYDSNGNAIWAQKAGGAQTDYCIGVGVDSLGNIYQTGIIGYSSNSFFGSIMLSNSNSIPDIYIAKYDSAGTPIWAQNIDGPCTASPFSIVTDDTGNSYVCGWYYNSSLVLSPFSLPNSGGRDAYIAKYNSNGDVVWAQKVGGSANDFAIDIALDKLNNLYVSGYFASNSLNINGTLLINYGSNDIFLSKINTSDGNFVWSKQIGGFDSDFTSSVCTDEGSNVYLVADYNSSSIFIDTAEFFNNGTTNFVVAKFNTNGSFLFALTAGGNNTDYAINSVVNDNNLYIAGDIQSTSSTYGSTTLSSGGISDVLVAKLDLGLGCSTLSSIVIDSCGLESYTSPSGNQTYTLSGNYFDTIPNVNSCDSLITISFNKKVIDTSLTTNSNSFVSNEINATYQWFDCNTMNPITSANDSSFYPFSAGNYAVEITKWNCIANSNCVYYCPESSSTLDIEVCESYTVPSGNYTYSTDGTYFDTIPNFEGCDSLITINLTIDTASSASFYSYLNPTDSLNLIIVNTSSGNISSYLWDFGDGNTSTLPYPQHTYSTIGNYQVCLTISDSNCTKTYCDSTSVSKSAGINSINVIAPIVTEISSSTDENKINIYPNPSKDFVYISISDDYSNSSVELLTLLGEVIVKQSVNTSVVKLTLPVNSGVYLLRITSDKKQRISKVIKH
ncbi:MAG: T9SS type A sorting domain-containing protein [Flavobacteriales bacterium]|nr:T9SS type A sorting domain-containing protein [Flavobacteriales bacterium]